MPRHSSKFSRWTRRSRAGTLESLKPLPTTKRLSRVEALVEANTRVDVRILHMAAIMGASGFLFSMVSVGTVWYINYQAIESLITRMALASRRQEGKNVQWELGFVLQRGWHLASAHSSKQKTGGEMRDGVLVTPALADTFWNTSLAKMVQQRNTAKLNGNGWMLNAALDAAHRTYLEVVGIGDAILLDANGEVSSLETCEHIMFQIAWGPLQPDRSSWLVEWQSVDSTLPDNLEALRTRVAYDYLSDEFHLVSDEQIVSCSSFQDALSDAEPVPDFAYLQWAVWNSGSLGDILLGFVPVFEQGRVVGGGGFVVPLQLTLSPILQRTIDGDIAGSSAIVYSTTGQVVAITETLEQKTQPAFLEDLQDAHVTMMALEYVREVTGTYCPESEHLIERGSLLVHVSRFDVEEFGVPPLTPSWCALTSVPQDGVFHHLHLVMDTGVLVGGLAFGAVFLASAILVVTVYFAVTSRRRVWKEAREEGMARVQRAAKTINVLSSPMVLMPASEFLKMGNWECHEHWRDEGKLRSLDSLEEIVAFQQKNYIVFISHQWLGFMMPDTEDCVQLRAMQGALRVVQKETDKKMFVWLDYISVAQRHVGLQTMAVAALPVYVSVVDRFIICAPDAQHRDTGQLCDLVTYSARGWCRMEMLAKACGTGLGHMYVCHGSGEDLDELSVVDCRKFSFHVFDGNFTRESDKEQLVEPVLGLYFLMLQQADEVTMTYMLKEILHDKARFFPARFRIKQEGRPDIQKPLFGDLVALVEALNDECRKKDGSGIETMLALNEFRRFPSRGTSNSSTGPPPVMIPPLREAARFGTMPVNDRHPQPLDLEFELQGPRRLSHQFTDVVLCADPGSDADHLFDVSGDSSKSAAKCPGIHTRWLQGLILEGNDKLSLAVDDDDDSSSVDTIL